jgi:hypothetical protein
MAINVICPDCQHSFFVSKEFGGKTGRCPECNGVLTVPHENSFSAPHEGNPYGRHDDFDDDDHDRLRPSRRRRNDPEPTDDFDEDFDQEEEYRSRRPQVHFDPVARAARWKGVGVGLRNLMLATVLFMLSQAVDFVYEVSTGMDAEAENWTNLDLGIKVGYATFLAFAMLLWAWGRMRCASVPYVPARGAAYSSGILSALTAIVGVLSLTGIVAGLIMLRNNPAGAVGMVMLGFCSMFLAMGGFIIAEIMGQVSQVRMANGLKYPPFAKAAKGQIGLACGLMLGGMFGFCVLVGVMASDAEKKKQQQMQQNGPVFQPPPPPPPKAGPFFKKGNQPAVVAQPQPNGPNGANGPNNPNNPPPPEFDPKEHKGLLIGVKIAMLCATMLYGFVSIACYNLGRRAVDREIRALVGDPHDQSGSEDEHF